MLQIAFWLTFLVIGILILALVVSIVSPSKRIWPPPKQESWQYFLVWIPTLIAFGGMIVVGVLDWNSLGLSAMVRWPIGVMLVLIGNLLAGIGVGQLSLRATSGAKHELITSGLYQYTRNPQYLGDVAILLGWALWCGSLWALPLTISGIVAFVLTPFAEEPWLEEVYSDDYQKYRQHVPRFLFRRQRS
jgi:protein-S-isoprenylcysteine O-methyltransferase Ste14